MSSTDLTYVAARVAALEALVTALLAERAVTGSAADIHAAASHALARAGYDDNELPGDGVPFNDTAQGFIAELVAQAEKLARTRG